MSEASDPEIEILSFDRLRVNNVGVFGAEVLSGPPGPVGFSPGAFKRTLGQDGDDVSLCDASGEFLAGTWGGTLYILEAASGMLVLSTAGPSSLQTSSPGGRLKQSSRRRRNSASQ